MTTASGDRPPGLSASSSATAATPLETTPSVFWTKVEALVESLSERLNPILVKEARQAMKSKQFMVTFSLLLVVGWVYTLLFVMATLPGVFYSPFGPAMLIGYYVILGVPLLIVIPYASFRSLAAELEDGTFDLLSITSLSARQIVTGKLGSSLLQMLVYYSALAPCIAFTYLLRGIDVVTIGLLLVYTFAASFLLSILSLTLSTVTRARHWQVLLSVLLVIALLLFAFFWCIIMLSLLIAGELAYDTPLWWMSNLAILTFYVPTALLFILIAAGQVTFASENRSTGVRVMLLVLQMLIVGWTVYFFLYQRDEDSIIQRNEDAIIGGAAWLALLWAVAGPFLAGETAELSPRARRELPQSLLGRMAFTWFNPGSGTGYVFTIASLVGGMLTLSLMELLTAMVLGDAQFAGISWWNLPELVMASLAHLIDRVQWSTFWVALIAYLAFYLGLARLVGASLRAVRLGGGMLSVFVSYLVLVVMGSIGPALLQLLFFWLMGWSNQDFEHTPFQFTNWVWTLIGILENDEAADNWTVTVLILCSGLVFLLNFVLAAKEVEQVRLLAPNRVRQDDLELHPPPKPAGKRNPWDEPSTPQANNETPSPNPEPGATS